MLLDPKIRESFGTRGLRLERIEETAPSVERFGLGSFTCWLPIVAFLYCFDLINFRGLSLRWKLLHNFALFGYQIFYLSTQWLYFHFLIFLSLSHPIYWTFFFFHFFLFNFFSPSDRLKFSSQISQFIHPLDIFSTVYRPISSITAFSCIYFT